MFSKGSTGGLGRARRLLALLLDRVHPEAPIESLYLMFTQVLVLERQTLGHNLIDSIVDVYASRAGQLLEALREHHSFSGHGAIGDHHLSHGNAHPKSRTNLIG
jgi:hypothetical protein